jgi:hypothetical protein
MRLRQHPPEGRRWRQRFDPLATPTHPCADAVQEKGHIGTEFRCRTPSLKTAQDSGGITTAATQSRFGRDTLDEPNLPAELPHLLERTPDQIALICWHGKPFHHDMGGWGLRLGSEPEGVVQTQHVHDAGDSVIAIGAAIQHFQGQVDFSGATSSVGIIIHDADVQLAQLLLAHGRGRAEHHIDHRRVFGEGNHIPNGLVVC